MWKAALAGALALAVTGTSLPVTTVHANDIGYYQVRGGGQGARLIRESQIARFKAALKLNREQERYWPAVAAALRNLRREARSDASFVRGLADRATEIAADALGLRRLMSAAMPLYKRLDDSQKQVALRIVTSMGFGSFVAAL